MSAVEQYRRGSRSRHLEASWALEQEADDAIAELDAKCKDLMKRLWTSEEGAAGLEAERRGA